MKRLNSTIRVNLSFDAANRLRFWLPLFLCVVAIGHLRAQTVQITSPASGTVVIPGQQVAVTVADSPAGSFQDVLLLGQEPLGMSQPLSAPPYQFSFQIPSTIRPGSYNLTAVGVITPGQLVDSAPISLAVERPDTPTTLTSAPSTLSLPLGRTGYLHITGTYADNTTADLSRSTLTTYASDNTSVATVDTYGRVTSVGPGSANINITNAGVSISVPVTVPSPMTILPASMSLYSSQSQQFYAQLTLPPGFIDNSVTWSVSPALGSVDSTGLYTPPSSVDSMQSVTLTATSNAISSLAASATITLYPPISVTVSPASATLQAGLTQWFTATVANAAPNVIWSINPPGPQGGSIADDGDYYTPESIPSALTVTVTAVSVADNTKTASAQVTLVPSVAISVSPTSATLYASQTQQFTAALTPIPGDSVTWSIAPAVGTISTSGLYSAPSLIAYQQTVTITATDAAYQYTASATITLLPTVSNAITVPAALAATPASVSEIDLSWSASSEPGATIAGYNIFRNGTWAGSSSTTSYSDLGLVTATQYTYTVAAYDTQGNNSAPSAAVSATTLAGPVTPGLVAYYNFNEGAGTALNDSSGNGNNGVVTATTWSGAPTAPTWTTSGSTGSALVFDGHTSVEVPDSTSLDLTAGMTLEAWTNPAASTYNSGPLVCKADGRYCLYLNANTPGVMISPGNAEVDGLTQLAPNAWTHLAATYDGATLSLYVNGVAVATQAQTGAMAAQDGSPTSSLFLGVGDYWYFSNYTYFIGTMDEVRIYNLALSQAQIQADMQAGAPPVSVSVSPSSAALYAAQAQQFSASVANTSNTAVTWSINPAVGSIDTSGLYSAPASIDTQQTVTVTATSQADNTKSASATITLMPPVAVSVSPASATLSASQTQAFTATVANTANTAVTWSLSPNVGTIDASGLYTAPDSISSGQTVTVTATSQADSTQTASAIVTLTP